MLHPYYCCIAHAAFHIAAQTLTQNFTFAAGSGLCLLSLLGVAPVSYYYYYSRFLLIFHLVVLFSKSETGYSSTRSDNIFELLRRINEYLPYNMCEINNLIGLSFF